MKSIRLSLMVYFLALLAVAMLAASLLVYRNAESTLASKQQAMTHLIDNQYRERCEKEKARLDADLLAQARSLARLVQVQIDRFRLDWIQPALRLGLLSSSLSPNGYFLAPTWIAEGERGARMEPPGPVYMEFRRHLPPIQQIMFDELDLPTDVHSGEYFFQFDSPRSKSYYSHSLGERKFPLDESLFDPDEVALWRFDDVQLGSDTPVRRVVFKASGVATTFPRRTPNRRGSREVSPPSQRPTASSPAPPPPPFRGTTIYVHCAAPTEKRDAFLAAFAEQRDEDLTKVAEETSDSLRDLRHWLWGISLAVFAATAAGGFCLVRLGLSPLQRLSCAVSKVSVKDFRLPLDERPLPRELRPIADRLRNTLDLLKRAFAREKQAAADISHELRTPLAALMTTTEFGLRKPRSPEQYRELLSDVHASAQQMHQIVERLLTLARLDAGVDRLRVQTVDAAALAQQCADVIRPLAEARGLKLTVKSPSRGSTLITNGTGNEGGCLVQVDPDKLREIVSNLLHNAIQYNRPGGEVDLRVGRQNGTLEVEVQDTGIGIAPEARERIFERFFRADPSRGGDDLHAGLGLAIVKEYIDLMGGSIGVESTEGQGSTFRVLLPVH
jgi:heavy metal sensor kinase